MASKLWVSGETMKRQSADEFIKEHHRKKKRDKKTEKFDFGECLEREIAYRKGCEGDECIKK